MLAQHSALGASTPNREVCGRLRSIAPDSSCTRHRGHHEVG